MLPGLTEKPYDFFPRQHIHLSLPQNKSHPLNKWSLQYQDSCGLVALCTLPAFKGQDVTTQANYLDGAVVTKWKILKTALSVADNLSQFDVLGLVPDWGLNYVKFKLFVESSNVEWFLLLLNHATEKKQTYFHWPRNLIFFNSLIIQKASVLTIVTLERLVYWPEMSSVCSGVRGRIFFILEEGDYFYFLRAVELI